MAQDYGFSDGVYSNLHLSLNRSADACVCALKSGSMNPVLFKPGNDRFNIDDLQAFSKMRKIKGIDNAFKKILIGSASWVLEELELHNERLLNACDFHRLLEYNLPTNYINNDSQIDLYEQYLEQHIE